MADYHSPTVVTPSIPVTDMTALENLLLQLVFDESVDGEGSYFHSWCGPSDILTIDAAELREAWEASRTSESRINSYVAKHLDEFDAIAEGERFDDIGIDLTGPDEDFTKMFQDIVRRSDTLDEIVVTAAFTCTKMRPGGFGGSVMRITANAIQYASTVDMLADLRNAHVDTASASHDDRDIRNRIEAMAGVAGWDGSTLLLLISRWLGQSQQAEALIDFLDRIAGDEED